MNWTPDRPTKPGKYWLARRGNAVRVVELTPGGFVWDVPDTSWEEEIESDYFASAQWRPYVEPPDPFAEPSPFAESADEQQRRAGAKWNSGAMDGGPAMPKPSEFKAYRLSDDTRTPNLRLILDVEPGMVTLYEADMTSRSPEAQETEMHDKIMMSQADARWLRDTLNNADLSDPPGWDR